MAAELQRELDVTRAAEFAPAKLVTAVSQLHNGGKPTT
jgi:hypothetical protein